MKLIFKKINEVDKEEVLKLIASNVQEMVDYDEVLQGLKKREEEVSTGLVNEIAVPHAMVDTNEGILVVLKNEEHIENWETMDGTKVNYVISIIAPKGNDFHLKTLTNISRRLMDENVVKSLKNSQTVEEVKEILNV